MNRCRTTSRSADAPATPSSWYRVLGEAERPLGALMESVRLADADSAQLAGTVSAAFFLGDRTRLFIECGGHPVIVETGERREFARDAPVHLAIDGNSLLLLKDSQ